MERLPRGKQLWCVLGGALLVSSILALPLHHILTSYGPSALLVQSAGYGKMRALGASSLVYEWVTIDGKILDTFTINK